MMKKSVNKNIFNEIFKLNIKYICIFFLNNTYILFIFLVYFLNYFLFEFNFFLLKNLKVIHLD